MNDNQVEKFIVFVESMRDSNNNAEIDVIMEGFFNVYGNKNQFKINDRESAMKLAFTSPQQMMSVWPRLYAKNPEILIAALENPDDEKSKLAYEFVKKFSKSDSNRKGTLGELIEKGVQTALSSSKELKDATEGFLVRRAKRQPEPQRMSRSMDKAVEKAWASGDVETTDKLLTQAGM